VIRLTLLILIHFTHKPSRRRRPIWIITNLFGEQITLHQIRVCSCVKWRSIQVKHTY